MRGLLPGVVFAFAVVMAHGEEAGEFGSIDAFLKSKPGAFTEGAAEGDLFGHGRQDWAAQLVTEDEQGGQSAQLYVLEALPSGRYRVAATSAPDVVHGGTGNWGVENIEISDKSLFVSVSYHWKNCAGNAVSQFQYRANTWRMIGLKSAETNQVDGSGRDVSTDTNLLTGNAIIKRTEHGKSRTVRIKTAPKVRLFQDFDGSDLMSIHEPTPVC